ncbi:MAG: DEAD/DEAH box helicase family protein [Chloroflexota bacterium]|nr:DEAD/DEAH box helicase family protein [Chloroflexota bacterium]
MTQILRDALDTVWDLGYLPEEIPEYVTDNLNPALPLRPYQKKALARLFYYLNGYPKRAEPAQLLFHMATGSGKTLIMAAAILYLYEQGYRNFIFFVNSTNIIEKTRENFLNALSSKYLFADRLKFGASEVHIRAVDNFQAAFDEDIRILFTTIQGLHIHLNEPRENSITYEDFGDQDIVLISDEAHHINTLTKTPSRLTKTDKRETHSWEATVNRIFNARPGNILLEYTATIELDNEAIRQKYEDKILYQYPLKNYREDGYSKEVKVLQADLPSLKRALQAIVISQYRRKVAEKHGILLKPVVLMKSRIIRESEKHEEEFRIFIDALQASDLKKLKTSASSDILQESFAYFKANDITLENLAAELREEFNVKRSLIVNSKAESEEKQILVNSLEDHDNQIRIIFAVNKLNEGWDVLNLFDIVRLYDTRDAKRGIPGRTTVSEAQLIGRGARYFPFRLDESQVLDQRKFDYDLDNELRVLEELYYHSAHNPRYISELHKALVDTGIVPPRTKKIKLRVKESFKQTDYWKNGLIFVNKRIHNPREDVFGLNNFSINGLYTYRLATGQALESALLEEQQGIMRETVSQTVSLVEFGTAIIRKALNKLDFYRFSHLKRFVPHLKSITEFITSDDYLNTVLVEIHGTQTQLDDLTSDDKLDIAIAILQKISREIKAGTSDFIGTKDFDPIAIRYTLKDKTLQISVNEGSDKQRGIGMSETTYVLLQLDLRDKAWYVYDENYGTSEEKHFVKFVHSAMDRLQERYQDIYLIRNERLFKIYCFSDGAALEPDFVFFATEKESGKSVIHQLFIEPKGDHLLKTDGWKEAFLGEIEQEAKVRVIAQNREYRLVGMPFYNETHTKIEFEQRFHEVLPIASI